MFEATLGLALAAGVLAAVNPCGFALLPAYVSMLVAADSGGSRLAAVGRALALTGAMTLGFVAVFGGFGLLAAPAADAVARQLPWLTVLLGLLLVILGGWLVAGRSLPALPAKFTRGPRVTRRFGSMVGFGAAYAVASLGCTIGPFLAVVVVAGFRQGSLLTGVGHFLAYAAGMALVIGLVALAVALARASVLRALRRSTGWLPRVGGAVLVLAGGYVAWYGAYELRVFAGGSASDPVVDAVLRAQSSVERWLTGIGVLPVAVAFGVALAAVAVGFWFRSRRRDRAGEAVTATARATAPASAGQAGPE